MTMSFQLLSTQSCLSAYVKTRRIQLRWRLNPVQAIPPPSTLLHTDESEYLPESKKGSGFKSVLKTSKDSTGILLSQSNTVGILGGSSVNSTVNFLGKLVKWSTKDGESGLPFVLCSDPTLGNELQVFDKSSHQVLNYKSEDLGLDSGPLVESLKSKRDFLEKSGARCIVMPCHISHLWYEDVSKGCPVTFLHMADCVARELKEAKLKPLEAGSPLRIGVLATNAILSAGYYQEKLQNEGFEVVLPDKATMEHTVIPAIEALNRKDIEGARNLLRIALQVLLVRAVNSVILASDDIKDLLPLDDPLLKRCIDPMDALARSTINWAQCAK
ncbi:hypothetical protein SDJN02_20218 [Cucurbita argyrosperma subsp. argyrosperma]|uniref:uncharacterized protein LOC111791072 n=1 Tax=Cucurbita pepo subsp. pepo TaxID=3664 RepID=UPI000C9D3F20|nr:uncharacterized protein LOC111791072 [Cucurbita pepo subsp. pepo]XP_023528032.1 uncharacterized protein LOC111791072 [Cucurbita pepo subsp. pepo]XP_023528033.1 uncharacterized protein LOC111791072 [Cucurbita pepo subsp. pepo]XP_023528034.1 uncharacterized protein LOC111791072 [Cucurbita pepo subsp. pepo]KAG7018350.1 hypothetical protein SDJN02_20218 [Cucurbita argyrosperma subsp. argyrosperma]